ncbi:TetR family transcriptional regulator [Streptomyces sp. NPDC056716]|uniref:TetR family transcriptional regulator n=1 Tax=unclassified Streptomyces TaxID=2593676 RepID=UPI00368FC9FD
MTERRRTRAQGGVKDTILDAAVDNFQRLGYHGTSMRDIARDAGITVASIYHHFPSKQRILQDIMVRVLSDVISLTRNALMRAGTDPSGQLGAVTHAWALFHTSRRAEALIGASELRSLDEVGLRLVVALRDEQERMFRDIVERGAAEGEFLTPYPQEAVRAILAMGSSIASWYRPDGGVSPARMAERYAALALGTVGSVRAVQPT